MVCDACHLPFRSNSFDYVIEKGTIDALMCGDSIDVPYTIMKEMVRVVREKIFLITHGGPVKRGFLFDQEDIKEVKYLQQPLSREADLINCMRSTLKDKPIHAIFKDKEALVKALMECKLIRQEKLPDSKGL